MKGECRHCGRNIENRDGRWIDPQAGYDEYSDGIWRETCDAHDTFTAEHEPVEANGNIGDWVKAVNFGEASIDDNLTVPPGTLGQVVFVDSAGQRAMHWENGSTISTIPGYDTVEIVLPAKPCVVCGSRCAASEPADPESYVHDEDGDWGDHTAEVT